MIQANAKIFKIIYRLTLPGSLLIVISALLIRVGVLADPHSPLVRFFPLVVFGAGLALSAFFRRSRLFFALLVLFLAQLTFAFALPHLTARASQITVNAAALLLPPEPAGSCILERTRHYLANRTQAPGHGGRPDPCSMGFMPAGAGQGRRPDKQGFCSAGVFPMEWFIPARAAGVCSRRRGDHGSVSPSIQGG